MSTNCRRNDAHPTRSIDDVVHQRVRLGILTVAYEARRVDFNFLLDTLSLTGGNLSQHLRVLEEAGLVRVSKVVEGRRPRTWVSITAKGRRALLQEMEALRAIVGRVKRPTVQPAPGTGRRSSPRPAAAGPWPATLATGSFPMASGRSG